jgi:2-octaprenylphenol hydroxylase
MSADCDVLVVGGGLAGACTAALLTRFAGLAPERIVLLADQWTLPRSGDAPAEPRVVAISRASERILQAARAWPHLNTARLCAYERVRVWHETSAPDGPDALCFDAADVGEPNLGHIAENTALAAACLAAFVDSGGTRIAATLQDLTLTPSAVVVRSRDGHEFAARLVVGADGAQSRVRELAGLRSRVLDYRQLAIVANVRTERSHAHTAWQRFLRTGPLALLPLFDGSSSIVWSVDRTQAQLLIDATDGEFEQRLHAASDEVLGRVALASPRISFPLRSLATHAYIAPRIALVGDAAHVIHPLAGQGANLGLLDAAALCESVAAAVAGREDVGALRALRPYERQRRTHNLLVDAAMSAFHSGFAATAPPGTWLVNRALGTVNRSSALKRAFARQALGLGGELPALARATPDGA